MSLTLKEIKEYLVKIKPNLKSELARLDEFIRNGREEENIPIYMSKYRIKSAESIFLKTKRKKRTTLTSIKDLAGYRILCLFEKDILEVHRFLIKELKTRDYRLEEVIIFNWQEGPFVSQQLFNEIIQDKFPEIEGKPETKDSGYKSIHYIVAIQIGKDFYSTEIQLRTLLQDVWGELEHALSYKKGSIHPHIKSSFSLLARDLETEDKLLSHLRDISEKEACGDRYSNSTAGPRGYFSYEDGILPEQFKEAGPIKDHYDVYSNIVMSLHRILDKKDKLAEIEKAKKAIASLCDQFLPSALNDKRVKYWTDMEDAFLVYCEGDLDKTYDKYKMLIEKYQDRYCLYFRFGEILLYKGCLEEALEAFDNSEALLLKYSDSDHANMYKIKVRLALIYWMLGDEYIDIALREINEAKKIHDTYTSSFSENDGRVLINNLCWYYLSKYITTAQGKDKEKIEGAFKEAHEKFDVLEKIIDKDSNSEAFDSAAWFCYHAYRKLKDKKYLILARDYCHKMGESVNYTSYNFRSMNIHINHIQEILNAK